MPYLDGERGKRKVLWNQRCLKVSTANEKPMKFRIISTHLRMIYVFHFSKIFLKIFFEFFRSRKKFSTTYAIVLFFFVFFSSRPFHENFKFLKNCPYDFHEILHSHYTPKGAPACAKASKSYGWDVRNIAKNGQKTAIFDFFRFSQKLSIRFERNFLQLFYAILESYMCNGIKIVWLGCEKHSQN